MIPTRTEGWLAELPCAVGQAVHGTKALNPRGKREGCCFVFLSETVSQMRPQEGTEEGSGERRVLYSAALEAGGHLGRMPGCSAGARQELGAVLRL